MKPTTRRLIESLKARASLVAAGVWQFASGTEQENRQDIARYEKRDKHRFRIHANLASHWTRYQACKIRSVDPTRGKTK